MVEEVAAALQRGAVVVIPTDTVYGLATRADNPEGIQRIYEIKGRPAEKPFQVLVSGAEALDEFAERSEAAKALARAFWPGPLTIVVRASARAPGALVREGRIGLRAPNHPLALALVAASGPLAATSANESGRPTPETIDELRALFGSRVDAYADGGRIATIASTVVDVGAGTIEILREGAIPRAALEGTIGAGC